MLTWGISGRGAERRAAVFCMGCREVLARDLSVNEAYLYVQKFQPIHQCKVDGLDACDVCSKCGAWGLHACIGQPVEAPTQQDEIKLSKALE